MVSPSKQKRGRLRTISELISFLRTSKRWWLGPIFVFLILLSLLAVVTESSALAPFLYSVF
ncbi:MAG: hypothetical protein JSU65_11810 [Candidatus Zixiibacteriota bacterium]|nr:MAG: hypothetical protein JSU65_11810 [candidate division Zixibacteria bacterium]